MPWLLRFGYDGSQFHGWARQPGLPTVEGTLVAGLRRARLLGARDTPGLSVASRTDRGVSARANALVVDSSLPGPVVLRALNGVSPHIFFQSAHRVPPGFRPRQALYRHYRYLEPASGHDVGTWRRLLGRFVGPVDTRTFGRGQPAARPVWRPVERADVSVDGPWMSIDLVAPSFVWGMVRKIVAAVAAVAQGTLPEAAVVDALAGRRRLTLPLAPPEPLILWEVGYPFAFEVRASDPSGRQRARWTGAIQAAALRQAVLERVGPAAYLERPPSGTP